MRLIMEGTPAELAAVQAGRMRPPEPEVVVRPRALPAGPAAAMPAPPRPLSRCQHATLPELAVAVSLGHHPTWYPERRPVYRRRWACVACGMLALDDHRQVVFCGEPARSCAEARRVAPGRAARLELRDGVRIHLERCRW